MIEPDCGHDRREGLYVCETKIAGSTSNYRGECEVEVMEQEPRSGRAALFIYLARREQCSRLVTPDRQQTSLAWSKSGVETGVCSAQTEPHSSWVSSGLREASRLEPMEAGRSGCLELAFQMGDCGGVMKTFRCVLMRSERGKAAKPRREEDVYGRSECIETAYGLRG
ncbi:hypothetical protein BDW02DRAFT_569449 [Decorospora gaudefroyi]|uniref:Uncharacterized protein n=1 Tax=Decorospora gaudefroyi TaxID=184978 RepID=A0A6A5KCI0_9PLEO|nr:hypothetical protein BDW02DRAFT_569449 [Decorospora gaudefroyi]